MAATVRGIRIPISATVYAAAKVEADRLKVSVDELAMRAVRKALEKRAKAKEVTPCLGCCSSAPAGRHW
jgi:hypothetical protein